MKRKQSPLEPFIIKLNRLQLQQQKGPLHMPIGFRLVVGLALLILIGTFGLWIVPGFTTRPLIFMEALFTATSAATVTGLAVTNTATTFTLAGQAFLLILIQIGGVGYMVGVVLILRLFGQHVSLRNRLALTSSLGLEKPAAVLVVLRRSLWGMLIIEGLGALLLYIHWRNSGIVPEQDALFYAVFHAISAFCNAGFDLFAGLPQYPLGIPGDMPTLIIMGLLVILGGLGIPVYADFITRRNRRTLSLHTRVTLATAVALILIGWLGLFLAETQTDGILYESTLNEKIVHTWFQSVSSRTAGFPGFRDFDNMQSASRLLVMALMFIGCAPASMGGGITTGTFAVMAIALSSYARGLPTAQIGKRAIRAGTVRRAGAVLTVSLGVVFTASWLILLTHNLSFDTVLFEVVSALATCGLSLGITGDLNNFGLGIIMIVMFWGRIGALTIVLAVLQRQRQTQLYQYPEESLLIG